MKRVDEFKGYRTVMTYDAANKRFEPSFVDVSALPGGSKSPGRQASCSGHGARTARITPDAGDSIQPDDLSFMDDWHCR